VPADPAALPDLFRRRRRFSYFAVMPGALHFLLVSTKTSSHPGEARDYYSFFSMTMLAAVWSFRCRW